MVLNRRPLRLSRPRNWRGLMAVLVAVMYLLSGALHDAHDIDVTSPSGGSEVASVLDGAAGDSDHMALSGHHCHGCFSAAVVQPMQSAGSTDIVAAPLPRPQPALVGIAPDTDSPPPKRLT